VIGDLRSQNKKAVKSGVTRLRRQAGWQ